MIRASIVGASGFGGGELLRLLLQHPEIEVAQVTSNRQAGSFVTFTHPNLRGQTQLKFCLPEEVEPCDLLFLALPHGEAMGRLEHWQSLAPKIGDLSADFRLGSAEEFKKWYREDHACADKLSDFVYGLPELNREAIQGADLISGVGCNATTVNLSLLPLMQSDLVDWSRGIVAEVKVGSSEGGARSTDASHHPVRAGSVRSFAPTGHRHAAEIAMALGQHGHEAEIHLSATAIEMIRGVLATVHVFAKEGVEERDIFKAYRMALKDEPFVRLVKEKKGLYRYPEPKILSGSNFAEVGFEFDASSRRIVAIGAIDNLMKGASGTAVQAANLMFGWDETTGLTFPGLRPI
jgi:N-acetyl-gamma-glutamyl-phosphate/LysW-gamma-L-alpha-aminoadipyl-6-phosphate reductase